MRTVRWWLVWRWRCCCQDSDRAMTPTSLLRVVLSTLPLLLLILLKAFQKVLTSCAVARLPRNRSSLEREEIHGSFRGNLRLEGQNMDPAFLQKQARRAFYDMRFLYHANLTQQFAVPLINKTLRKTMRLSFSSSILANKNWLKKTDLVARLHKRKKGPVKTTCRFWILLNADNSFLIWSSSGKDD